MSWNDFTPPPPAAQRMAEIVVSSSAGRGGLHPVVTITMRPWLMEGHPPWMRDGARLRALIGKNEHAGMIRIVDGGPLLLKENRVGKFKADAQRGLILTLRGMPGVKPFKAASAACEWSSEGDGWIEITLPGGQGTGPSAPAVVERKAPFSMLQGTISREEPARRGSGLTR